ncbi:uncharacterized protein LOC119102495 [Pollicipes pollicipes]|nr:uncharacterized protein LOC119102495 [Pollicipes pollicipes]
MDAKYSNVIVHGLSSFELRSLDVDPVERTVAFDLSVPEVDLTGDYDVRGSFLVLVVTSRGNFSSQLRAVDVIGSGDLVVQPAQAGGRSAHVQMENLLVQLEFGETHHELDFSPDTHPVIGETVRHLVTKNDRVLLQEVRPELEAKVAELMSRLVNQVLTVLPVDAIVDRTPQASHLSQATLPAARPGTDGSTVSLPAV